MQHATVDVLLIRADVCASPRNILKRYEALHISYISFFEFSNGR